MKKKNELASMQDQTRDHPPWETEDLVDAWRGCQRRLGPTLSLSSTEHEVIDLVKASKIITGSINDNCKWILAVLAEVKQQLAEGTLTMEKIGGTENSS